MKEGNEYISKFFKLSGVFIILLICVPIIALILSNIASVNWEYVENVCVVLGVGAVSCVGIALIIAILTMK